MVGDDDGKQIERELLGVDGALEMSLVDREAGRFRERAGEGALRLDEGVARGAGVIIELGGGGEEEAAAGKAGIAHPVDPALEELPDARLAARPGERRPQDVLDEARSRRADDLDLQILLGAEVRDQAALRHAEV